jgi:hypothetical protein
MRLAKAMERASDNSISLLTTGEIAMHIEFTIVERVEAIVRHPVFPGSDKAMHRILEDLEAMAEGGRIHRATCRRLGEMILKSPHFANDN